MSFNAPAKCTVNYTTILEYTIKPKSKTTNPETSLEFPSRNPIVVDERNKSGDRHGHCDMNEPRLGVEV
ncbi:unnamed protein product [Cochlearia groenlandica]